ncbi:hypothetical protein RradSPS_0950 [Rubrobacter radiotolerans]|uniref:Isoprenylcysteine carboxylmethyltransferase family protein n=1 Tax=Rubrobacter radiotolerans TaxID=42256 RepID=A0A023X1L7_RUBRA|nr:isoprenylcysteine carboxylmethyltransferase family protein [Rubrobacter radiotolerans]AHY46233.1 hypothetical protein RradSPS_0950 [Rubrobacter radiotolerans]MDX5893641.1 isoprenylcysteine carboxylmethyltransferase family protein [Rubrobacter radiotolerans]SMC04173.1 methyltransferase [Rubrobacter radiotolerans DSM 5868]
MTALFLVLAVLAVGLQRLLELRLSRRNERRLRARGAVEHGAGHYPVMVALHSLWLVSLLAEGLLRGPEAPAWWPLPLGLFLAAQILRYWSISSLGDRWTTRVLVPPDEPPVQRGPYRYLRHPNYVAVVTELAALPLVFGAFWTALIFSILNAALLYVRIRREEDALRR